MRLRHPPTLAHVEVLKTASWKRYFVIAIFVLVYAVAAQLWVTTIGEPYEWALAEQKRLVKEKAAALKEKGVSLTSGNLAEKKDAELEIDFDALPSKVLPSAWTCALIFATVAANVLFCMCNVWMVSFKAAMLFQPCRHIVSGCFVRVTPRANKGKAAICKVEESDVSGKMFCIFQYQVYELVDAEAAEADADLLGPSEGAGMRLIKSPVDLQWKEYTDADGLKTEDQVERAQDRFGTNVFELPRPTFWQLYQKQLMAPLAIFQFFCTVLWMLDTYWKYTCFTLMSILGFEASTAFQRLKSMATLRGMSMKSYNVYIYRIGKWEERPIEDLLPGDIISLTSKKDEVKEGEEKRVDANSHLTVPCDCLLLRGCAIVNEATLTGESVPQMKDAPGIASDASEKADPFNKHRVHTLFSGTTLIQAAPAEQKSSKDAHSPPNDGIVCYVLRTGFNSSQGELMRMIEFSTQDVTSDKWETCCQLLFLLMFALVAAGYVLKKGLEDPTKPTYKTLLRCTLIITSVVPPSLPMQMAFAVHTALMSLLRTGIFCTEPFRVPYAGKVEYCFFDKTGTLTSDQMVAVGVVDANEKRAVKGSDATAGARMASLPKEANTMAAMVLAGCHSLIEVDGKAIGDPIEVAALRGVAWSYEPAKKTGSPGAWRAKEQTLMKQKEYHATLREDIEADKKEKVEMQKSMDENEKKLKAEKQEAKKLQCVIEQRFHFSSELQRMSTICKVASSNPAAKSGTYCLTKGSPEAIGRLLAKKPEWYDATYTMMSEKGQRVLALAYRHLSNDQSAAREYAGKPRDAGESEMTFAGFIAFKCETRKDSPLVIKALQDSSHTCIMLTGDAPLTALSVGREVGISQRPPHMAMTLCETEGSEELEWRPALTAVLGAEQPAAASTFDPSAMGEYAKTHDLIITGKTLEVALLGSHGEALKKQMHHVCIFARMSPSQKEQVIQAVRNMIPGQKVATLMCGDGGNDVGALKEADVGLALLSGFGNANVGAETEVLALREDVQGKDAEEALGKQRQELSTKAMAMSKKANDEMTRKRKDLMSKQQQWVEEELERRRQNGEETGIKGQMGAMMTVMGRLKTEIKSEQEAMSKKHGNAFAAGAAKWTGELEGMEDTPMVQLGDASTAAPFTSRTPSIGACVDIIRQGRCTLLSAVQQMEIMMLESMISAYTMSTMSVDGTRPSEAQMMASGTLMSVASLAFSFARPLDRMHPVRPLSSVFHPAILFSMLGQLVIHLSCMVFIASVAKDLMGQEAIDEIKQFEKDRNKVIEGMDEEAFNDWTWFMSVPFKPNLLNTCCWLVETSQQIAVIFVNYKGRPWMKGLLENQPLFLSLFACIALVAVCAWGAFPYLNETLNLVVMPEDLRMQVMGTLFVSLIGSFCWDRLMVFVFARHIWEVQVAEAKAVTFADFWPLIQTVGYSLGGLLFLGTGNPLLWGLAFMMYRSYKAKSGQQAVSGSATA